MFAEQRLVSIASIIKENKSVTVSELSEMFDVSEATIRRDLSTLEKSGEIIRTHGGAMVTEGVGKNLSLYEREIKNKEAKEAIARKAIEYINDGDVIILDAGSTTTEIARRLNDLNITVITNAINIASELSKKNNINIVLIAGSVDKETLASTGLLGISTLDRLYADKAFIGMYGVSVDFGLTTPTISEAEIKEKMLSITKEKFIVADHSKINNVSLSKVTDLDKIDAIITDEGIKPEDREDIEEIGVKVIN
jgi:DeoR family transcriptional regulator, fructose operon transcriptional repressor